MKRWLVTLSLASALAGCGGTDLPPNLSWVEPHALVPEPGRHDVTVTATRAVVPGPGLPQQVTLGQSNNNLDVVRHGGRTYLAFRTAPNHFANPSTVLYVVSSADEVTWDFEYQVSLGTDLREPRLLSIGGRLYFYFAVLGQNELTFEPMGVRFVEKTASGWGPIETYASDDRIVWRMREHAGTAYMTSYTGGAHIYLFDGLPLDVQFLSSSDGRAWSPVGDSESIYTGGSSETDFAWDSRGDAYFLMRTEALDPSGIGSKICVARHGDPSSLYCRSDPKKYDSPLMFEHDGEIYAVGRRNVTETGYYGDPSVDYQYAIPGDVIITQLEYRSTSKRCSLWRLVRGELRMAYLLDLPSTGDTCFASVLPGATPEDLVIYDYSSDPSLGDVSWVDGQNGPTSVYRHELHFEPR